MLFSRKTANSGQSIIETALLLGSVAAALVFFFSYIRAATNFRVKQGVDTFGHGRQYEPTECSGSTAILCFKRSP